MKGHITAILNNDTTNLSSAFDISKKDEKIKAKVYRRNMFTDIIKDEFCGGIEL